MQTSGSYKSLFLLIIALFLFDSNIFGQLDITRRTTAVTYPLDEQVTLQFRGTTRFPRMKGEAKMRRTSRNGTEIDLSVSKMPRPFELGAGYATYVLWAISPDGHADNLGEIKRRGFFEFDSKIRVTTPLQTFALIITAEPHFLVRRPSQEIMLENLNPVARSGRTIATVPAVQYFGNSSDYFRDSRTPEIAEIDYSKMPSTLLQAKQAVALARFAGADRDAAEDLAEADMLLKNAEDAWSAGRKEDEVDITARRAISTAARAESNAITRAEAREKRNEQTRADAEVRQIEDQLTAARQEVEELKKRISEETRYRELSERDANTYSEQIRELRAENGRLREELGRSQLEASNVKAKLTVIENEKRAEEDARLRDDKLRTMQANEAALIRELRKFGAVSKSERGIIVTLPENFWSAPRAAIFAPNIDTRLSSLSEILNGNPDYKIEIESHTDDAGTPEELEQLTRQRSQILAERLGVFGIPNGRIETRGLGASIPVAPNNTNANRARNRRVQMILVPAI
ncbi:MAG TPA: OmpA family protein [Pyrinomonadaceae bacterium]|nr:OmpA family protein [Pyrinomonadaceae bacterium]